MRTAFIGLGVMGYPMAGHLARAGHAVTVFNRTPAKAERWAGEHGGKAAETIADAVADAELVALCVGNDDDVRQVVAEALPALGSGAIIVDHTTASAKIAREMAEAAAAKGCAFLDAPVSGGQAGAENGQLAIMIGGDAAAVERARPVIGVYAKAVQHMGGPGSGQLTKMVNQICIAGVVQGLAEAMHFAKRAELDTGLVYKEGDLQRRRAVVADGQPLEDHGRGQVRLRFRGRLDAQGPGLGAGRGAGQRGAAGGDRSGRPVLRRGAVAGRPAVGHLQPGGATGAPMSRLRDVFAIAALLAPAMASAETVACDAKLNVTDQDPAGLNVRASPGGAVVTALKAKNRWVQVHVTGADGTWARIDRATFISEDNAGGTPIFRGVGWVAFAKLGIEELQDRQAAIVTEPKDGARTLLQLSAPDEASVPEAEVLGCDGAYLRVRVKGLVGWTQNYCSNQFTTCV